MVKGKFKATQKVIEWKLKNEKNLSELQIQNLHFALERMKRIRKDFSKNEADILAFIRTYLPDVKPSDLRRWEKAKTLEYKIIDGKKKYFNQAARNLFRLDGVCKKIWQEKHAQDPQKEKFDLNAFDRSIIQAALKKHSPFVKPVRMLVKYTLTVKPDQVPAGETVRCWIPFPREIPGRQARIKILSTIPEKYKIAPQSKLQRTVYFEKKALPDSAVRFGVEYAYTAFGVYVALDSQKIEPIPANSPLAVYLKEQPPHIVFSDTLRALSRSIVGSEKNPYRIAQKLFAWVDKNITWASAREYSTIDNLSLYPYVNRHGDCGIQTMLFITLCRMNGIPARWQSGWEFQPPKDSMHDWGMIYFAPYGWMPMDVTYGLRQTKDESLKWFYLHGMDSYRLIFNDGFSKPFTPSKKYFRSETVDSQRGEVEWRGGNLYFDQWNWNMEWRQITADGKNEKI